MLRPRLLFALALVVAACGNESASPNVSADAGSGDTPAGDGTTSDAVTDVVADGQATDAAVDASSTGPTVEQLCPALAKKQCAALAACGCPGAAAGQAACEVKTLGSCDKSVIAFIGGISLGTLSYDAKAASACLAGFDQMASQCAQPSSRVRPAECRMLWVDAAEVGKPCAAYAVGLLCAKKQGFCNPDAGNTCAPLPTAGQGCPKAHWCAAGLVCDGDQCQAPGAVGAACASDDGCQLPLICGPDKKCATPIASGGACQSTSQCASGLRCAGGSCAAALALASACLGDQCGAGDWCVQTSLQFVCRSKGKAGEACSGAEACADGLFCDYEGGSVCKPLPKLGEKCPGFACAAGLSCDATATCVTSPGEGEACTPGASPTCAAGLGCDPGTGKCAKPGGVGSTCLDGQCAPGSYCDYLGNPPKCAAPKGKDGPCTGQDSACESGLYCDGQSNLCTPTVGTGATCQMSNACGPGFICKYASNSAPSGVCAPTPTKPGEACQDMCGSGLFCGPPDGTCSKGICALL